MAFETSQLNMIVISIFCGLSICMTSVHGQGLGPIQLIGDQHMQLQIKCQGLPKSCKDVNSSDPRVVTTLWDGLEVVCDTETDGSGWTVIQRRVDGAMDFFRNWTDYKYGFGNITGGSFWLGNEWIHELTVRRRHEMRIDMTFKGVDYFVHYDSFRLLGSEEKYRLEFDGFSGNTVNALEYHNNRPFTTKDQDNDKHETANCADRFKGGWWYGKCHDANLNGLYGSKAYAEGLTWDSLTTDYDTLSFSEMKIRPVH